MAVKSGWMATSLCATLLHNYRSRHFTCYCSIWKGGNQSSSSPFIASPGMEEILFSDVTPPAVISSIERDE